MGKGKLAKFADMDTYENVFQYPYGALAHASFPLQGRWHEDYFHNQNPIVLELGCGKGEYTVGLAKRHPNLNFIGVDIKGARMWTGATQALKEGLKNVAFLRTNIEIIDRFFAPDEVQELWLTFSDPQMKNPRKRLTSTNFLERYRHFLVDGGTIHLKTDSKFLFTYTTLLVEHNRLPLLESTTDLYGMTAKDSLTSGAKCDTQPLQEAAAIQTYYESMWIARGLSIKYMQFQLPREGRLEKPDVEIELDDYRSYHRDKRSSLDKAK
ncbi:MAG: tRNA (guanosine(46)-N7)-methyltransferase TrmB [Prevotella sp.]|nr:tRNA (guanosine(46)-N7)-methyltransferase TrmB [Prevotella sp.]